MAEATAKQIIDLEAMTAEQIVERLGVPLARANELLAMEREALAYADVFVVDPKTGISMTEQTFEVLNS